MIDLIWLWLAKLFVEIGLFVFVVLLIFSALLIVRIPRWIKQSRCPHDRVHETQACDAICLNCGKNLGFIGVWRENRGKA